MKLNLFMTYRYCFEHPKLLGPRKLGTGKCHHVSRVKGPLSRSRSGKCYVVQQEALHIKHVWASQLRCVTYHSNENNVSRLEKVIWSGSLNFAGCRSEYPVSNWFKYYIQPAHNLALNKSNFIYQIASQSLNSLSGNKNQHHPISSSCHSSIPGRRLIKSRKHYFAKHPACVLPGNRN